MLAAAPIHRGSAAEFLYLLHGDPAELAETLRGMRAADIADALRTLPEHAAAKVTAALPFELAVEVLDEPEMRDHRCDVIRHVDEKSVGQLIDAMSADQQAGLFRELSENDRKRLIKTLDVASQKTLTLLLKYKPDTAGGLMTTEFVSMPTTWTVEQALKNIAEVGQAKETVYAIYVVEPTDHRLVHVVSLRQLMIADRNALVLDVGDRRDPLTVTPHTDREDVARLISKYNLLAVPVIDEGGHVLGIVTVDDIIDAIVHEQTEDAQKFGGMEALDIPYTEIGFWGMIKKRAGWLTALFLGEMLTATAMGKFEGEIEKAVVLALFVPLIISSGGNSGSQATSLIIRALALRELTLKDWWRVAMRELPSGLVLGGILGAVGVVRILLWQSFGWYNYGVNYGRVAATVGLALIGVVTFGSMAGSLLPFLLKRLGFDPASASAPFVATLVDVTGLVIYFSVALVLLRGTLL